MLPPLLPTPRLWVLSFPPGTAIQVQRLPGRVSIVVDVPTNPPLQEEDMQLVLLHGTERGALH